MVATNHIYVLMLNAKPHYPLPGQGGALLVKPSPGGGNFVKAVYYSCLSVY